MRSVRAGGHAAAARGGHAAWAGGVPSLGGLHLFHVLEPEICKIDWTNIYFLFMALAGKLYLASSVLDVVFYSRIKNLNCLLNLLARPLRGQPTE